MTCAPALSTDSMPLGDPHGLLDQRLDDLGLGDGLDDLALTKIWPLPLPDATPRSASARLAGTVHDATHHGHAHGTSMPLQPGRDLVGELVDVDLGARAARGQETISRRRGRRLSDSRICRPTFTSSTGGAERETRIVSPMPFDSSAPNAVADLIVPLERRAGLGHAEVQRPVAALGESSLVGADHHDGVVVLATEILKSWKSCSSNRLAPTPPTRPAPRGCLAVLLEEPLVQGARR